MKHNITPNKMLWWWFFFLVNKTLHRILLKNHVKIRAWVFNTVKRLIWSMLCVCVHVCVCSKRSERVRLWSKTWLTDQVNGKWSELYHQNLVGKWGWVKPCRRAPGFLNSKADQRSEWWTTLFSCPGSWQGRCPLIWLTLTSWVSVSLITGP